MRGVQQSLLGITLCWRRPSHLLRHVPFRCQIVLVSAKDGLGSHQELSSWALLSKRNACEPLPAGVPDAKERWYVSHEERGGYFEKSRQRRRPLCIAQA